MSKENRFEGLMGAVGKKSNVQTSKHRNVSKSTQNEEKKHLDAETSGHLDLRASSNPDIQTSEDSKKGSNTNVSTSKRSDVQMSKAKSANPDYVRTTIYLPKKMHKKLKAIAVEEEREMSAIMEELLGGWLESK